LRLIAVEDVGPTLASLRIPVLVVQFEGDLVIGPHARGHLESVCHDPHVLRLPGPHFALETRPVETARAIEERLEAVLGLRA
jgi:pimeloyl-ACP methyl ester carboxylesterase